MKEDRSPVDTAEMRRLLDAMTDAPWEHEGGRQWRPYPTADRCYARTTEDAAGIVALRNSAPALLDEIDSLRARLAESEAACAVLAAVLRQAYRDLEQAYPSDRGQVAKIAEVHVSNLPASVRAHMEEDAALREVARCAAAGTNTHATAEFMGAALHYLDAVRAKGGG